MKGRIDPRIHALLDGELDQLEAGKLREGLRRDEAARKELQQLEGIIAASRRAAPAPSADFERRVMARIAARPPPRPGFWSRLRAARPGLETSWAGLAAAALLFAGVGGWLGFQAGLGAAGRDRVAAAPARPRTVLVRFAIRAPEARRVELAGTFNGWGARGIALERADDGTWVASLELPRGRYEYAFVIDGERWLPDPSAALVADGFGGHNAVLEL
jgi:anti-sigma factor RsiW